MTEIIGVRFQKVGKIYYFDPCDQEIEPGTKVIVETSRGIECGQTVLENRWVQDDEVVQPLKPIKAPVFRIYGQVLLIGHAHDGLEGLHDLVVLHLSLIHI